MFFNKHAANRQRLGRVAKLYLAYKFIGALYFSYPIFYQFAAQVITPMQVGFFFSALGICSFVAEVPTGILADKYGRKLSGLGGMILLSVAPLIVWAGHTFFAYLVAAVFYGLGRSLLSGALESLVYDHKTTSKVMYRKINGLEITFGQAGILTSAAIGGLLFSLHQSLPFVIESLACIVCIFLIALMSEQNKAGHVKPATSHRQHFMQSMKHLFATSYLRIIVLLGVTFSVMLGMCIQFVNEAAMIEYGLQPQARGLLISGAGIATLALLHLVILKAAKSEVARIIYLTAGAVTAYFLMSTRHLSFFIAGYLLWCCLNATSSFIRVIIHDRIPSSHRATIMSNFKALAVLVGLGASTATGMLVQQAGTPRAAYAVFGTIACLVLLPCAYYLIAHSQAAANVAVIPETE